MLPKEKVNNDIKNSQYQHISTIFAKEFKIKDVKIAIRAKYRQEDVICAHKTRKAIWKLLSHTMFRQDQNPNFYQALLENNYPEYYGKVIENDVKRTQ